MDFKKLKKEKKEMDIEIEDAKDCSDVMNVRITI